MRPSTGVFVLLALALLDGLAICLWMDVDWNIWLVYGPAAAIGAAGWLHLRWRYDV